MKPLIRRIVISALVVLAPAATALAAQAPADAVDRRVRSAWQGLYTAAFNKTEPVCQFDYGPVGMRNLFCCLGPVISYKDLVALSGLDPFLKGPHTKDKLDLKSKNDFGRYNPKFVAWLGDHLIPGATDEKFRWVTAPIYEKYLQKTARIYWRLYNKLQGDQEFRNRELKLFNDSLAAGQLDPVWFTQYFEYLSDAERKDWTNGDDYLFYSVVPCSIGFWIRRQVDGTAPAFFTGLEKLLAAYDADFLKNAKAGPRTPPPAGFTPAPTDPPLPTTAAEKIRITTADPAMQRFLEQLVAFMEAGNWDAVLTLFSPANYEGQKKLGIGRTQYIVEGLGLGTDFKLETLRTVELTRIEPPDAIGIVIVRGEVALADGRRQTMTLYLRRLATGAWVLEPPVG